MALKLTVGASNKQSALSQRIRRALFWLVAGALVSCGSGDGPGFIRPSNATCRAFLPEVLVGLEEAFPDLPDFDRPVFLLQAPGDSSRWFLVEQGGVVRTFANSPTVSSATVFLDIQNRVDDGASEAGLLGMAFHPDFAANYEAFLSYTADDGEGGFVSRISRFTSSDSGLTLNPASEEILLTLDQPFSNHNGGHIVFGPDGYLYIGFGDGGSGGDPQGNGQNPDTLLGKILRIDVDGGTPYAVPNDNPFAPGGSDPGGGLPEIYALGFRNPWRWSFDADTGDLWVGDVGQADFEEIDPVEMGGNYGWNIREGAHCYDEEVCDSTGLVDPIAEYNHSQGNAVTGGYVYRGTAIASFLPEEEDGAEVYIYGDFGTGNIWGLFDPYGLAWVEPIFPASGLLISSFAEGLDGEIYVVDYSGSIHQIVESTTPAAGGPPALLSETGCVNPNNPAAPAAGLIPFEINHPFWSDGGVKSRYLALPDGEQITIQSDGDLDFPEGTVLVKYFRLDGELIETRLLMRRMDGAWEGFSYEWNDVGTDADLLETGKLKPIGSQTWVYPSRSECLMCHTEAAGRSLGLELGQLNRSVSLGDIQGNQLLAWAGAGLFEDDLPTPLPILPGLTSGGSLEQRARAYLHANCSQCHRPGGEGQGPEDFRYSTSLADMGACNVSPTLSNLGNPDALLLKPGEPENSIISMRMRDLVGGDRMPPLGSTVLDEVGAQLIDDWIESLQDCN
ncbi:MAG: PQQ-dependent sugar dehydrogenase [Bdellovibrionota bacterium]